MEATTAIQKEWPGGWIGGEEHISYLFYIFYAK
jgi:hypothetical protein